VEKLLQGCGTVAIIPQEGWVEKTLQKRGNEKKATGVKGRRHPKLVDERQEISRGHPKRAGRKKGLGRTKNLRTWGPEAEKGTECAKERLLKAKN